MVVASVVENHFPSGSISKIKSMKICHFGSISKNQDVDIPIIIIIIIIEGLCIILFCLPNFVQIIVSQNQHIFHNWLSFFTYN